MPFDAPALLISRDATGAPVTSLVLVPGPDGRLPRIAWWGPGPVDAVDAALGVGLAGGARDVHHASGRAVSLLPEPSEPWRGTPGLAGFRVGPPATGRDWSTVFGVTSARVEESGAVIEAADAAAGLALRTEIEATAGGGLRARHALTNTGASDYVVEVLDVLVPVPDDAVEALDFTGRHAGERVPQRHVIKDGTWLRAGHIGKTGVDAPTLLAAGTAGFGFGHGTVRAVHVGWSGNSRFVLDRQGSGQTVLGGGENLLPGEMVLAADQTYTTPWVYFTASAAGLDPLAWQAHEFLRSEPAHPGDPRPVNLNVWEAVYFDHDIDRLRALAETAAGVGVERFVLDDGWFGARRNDHAGLGDWQVSPDAWPDGLDPLIEHVHGLGMQFGLWFEPEMINPDSDLYRAHPEWALSTPGHDVVLSRQQLVLDIGRADVRAHILEQVDAVLAAHAIDYVKWDHNRDLLDAGTGARAGAPGVHAQTEGYYDLLDELRRRHPAVEWESCAGGGGRIDLGVLPRVQRVWTSDQTDALARQPIQRWTGQLVPPEYLGAHVSSPVNHNTGRTLPLDFRVQTAFFGDFGFEWDLTTATPDELDRVRRWVELYKAHRAVLHGGRTVRLDSVSPVIWQYGVRTDDAVVWAYVQLDYEPHDLPAVLVPGLDPDRRYRATAITPDATTDWGGEGVELSGAALGTIGLPAPGRWPETVLTVALTAVS